MNRDYCGLLHVQLHTLDYAFRQSATITAPLVEKIADTTQVLLLKLVSPNDSCWCALSGQMMVVQWIKTSPASSTCFIATSVRMEEENCSFPKRYLLHFYEIMDTNHASYSIEKLDVVKNTNRKSLCQTAKMLNATLYHFSLCGTLATDPSDVLGTNAYDSNRYRNSLNLEPWTKPNQNK